MMDCTNEKQYTTGIFSGRFDPPHIGHLITVFKLAQIYGKIVIVILDYPDRKACSAEKARVIFDKVFDLIFSRLTRSKIDVIVNDVHFAEMTYEKYYTLVHHRIGACLNHTVYLSGNEEVLKNMNTHQIPYERIERSEDDIYTGGAIRREMQIDGKPLEDYCGK